MHAPRRGFGALESSSFISFLLLYSLYLLIGGGCRARVVMKLRSRFLSPSAAKRSYDLPHDENESRSDGYSPLPIQRIELNPGSCLSSGSSLEIVKEDPLAERIAKLSHDDQLQLMSQWLTNHASEVYGLSIPSDFILLTL